MEDPKVVEGTPVVEEPKLDKDGKNPETVTWTQYVGIKESLGKKADTATEKVKSLEEQIKKAPNAEEFEKLTGELKETKDKLTEASDELKTTKEQTLTEKRDTLVKRGVSEDKVKDLSAKELDAIAGALGTATLPKPDLGDGGGSGNEVKTGKAKMSAGFETLHPSNK